MLSIQYALPRSTKPHSGRWPGSILAATLVRTGSNREYGLDGGLAKAGAHATRSV